MVKKKIIKQVLFTSILLLTIVPTITQAKNLLHNGNFKSMRYWVISGKCQRNPDTCIRERIPTDLNKYRAVSHYFRFGHVNTTDSISQIVKLSKHKLKLKFKLKFFNTSGKHYKSDLFSIIVTGKGIDRSWRKDIAYNPKKHGWQQLDYNLHKIAKINQGEDIVVSFFVKNNNRGLSKAQITNVRLIQSN
ncbi:MAG: hypothetical protein WCV88_02400 [Patescibacteria group bacterium]